MSLNGAAPGNGAATPRGLSGRRTDAVPPTLPHDTVHRPDLTGIDHDPDHGADLPRQEVHTGQLRIALRFTEEHADTLRYVHESAPERPNSGMWHCWDGTRWAPDQDGQPLRCVKDTLARAREEARDQELRADCRKSESANGVEGVLHLARCFPPLTVSHAHVDQDGWLFNTTGGTIDLRSGDVIPHDRAHLITKCAVGPLSDHHDEAWQAFLEEVLPDPTVRAFVQRLMGVAMLGEVREHLIPIFHGPGGSGKGVFRDVLLHTFGDYAVEVDPDLLIETKHERHGTYKMQLRGRRLVFCSETEQNKRFAVATAKRLSGGDPINANKMRQDAITFPPTHTFTLVTNHLPLIPGDEEAIWRRIHVVPFDVVTPANEQDGGLSARLKAAAPGVLRWALDGWQQYQQIGLAPPEPILRRTAEYRANSPLGRFITEECATTAAAKAKATDLYEAFTKWCSDTGEAEPPNQTQFGRSMTRKGYTKTKQRGIMTYQGIGLLAHDDPGGTVGRVFPFPHSAHTS